MNLEKIKSYKNDIMHVIIETPQYESCKYAYDPELKVFKLNKVLPSGTKFPFDFGFIPNTICGDGDPLNVLVLIEGQTYPGCLVASRIIGVLEIAQEENNKLIRNDHLVAVSVESLLYADVMDISQLDKKLVSQIQIFFTDYNDNGSKRFKSVKWRGSDSALKKIKECEE
jgi:inorganic pyrophosphatase